MNDSDFKPLRISDMSEDSRPREKALSQGIGALSEAELLAVILGGGLPGLSVVDLCAGILKACGNSLSALSKMQIKEMTRKFRGVGTAKAVAISAVFELSRRLEVDLDRQRSSNPVQVTSSTVVDRFMRTRTNIADIDYEEFWVLFLNRRNVIKSMQLISRGGVASTVVDPKLIYREAIDNLASGLVLVHNHPSGNLTPSVEDDRLTRKLKDAGALFDIRVLDHLILTSAGYYSYNDQGRL